jgi:hypothetical protein
MANYSGTAAPGAAPTAVKELLKPADLRAQPVEPIKPTKPKNNAPAEEKAAYEAAMAQYNTNKTAYDADLKAWKTEKSTYDTAIKDYNAALPQYEKDLAKYNADKAAFDEQVRKYGLDRAAYDKYAADYQNRIGNTNLYNQAQFSTTGANVPAFTTYSDAQKAAMGMPPVQQAPVAPQPESNVGGFIHYWTRDENGNITEHGGNPNPVPQPGPQDFAGIGQGGLNQQIQNYMGTNPSMPDLQAMQMRYGISDYDIRNAMGTGTQYGAPQWQDTIKAPIYSTPTVSSPLGVVADTLNGTNTGTTTGTTTGTNTGTTTGTNTGTTTGTNTGTTATVYDPNQTYWDDPNWYGSAAWQEWKSNNRARGGYIKSYAQGGSVKGYRPGGPVDMLYGGAGNDEMMGRPAGDRLTTPAPAPVDPMAEMRAMLDLYAAPTVTSEQIAAAAERRVAEQKAFEDILRSQLQDTDGVPMSKAEKYFRLAAAFGAPTKTGHFAENLSLVGKEMADQLAARAELEREAREKRLGVDLEIQKMRMEAAGEDYDLLQGLQADEAKYRRDVAKELLKEQMEAGKNKFRRATAEEAAAYNAAAGQFGPDGRFYAIDVPQGMTIESDGAGGVRIVQGPTGTGGSGKPPTEGQLAGAGYLQRMTASEEILRDTERREGVVSIPVEKTILMDTGIEGYVLNSTEQQLAQAQRDWVRAKLRKESGAVIGAEEMAAEIKTYFPQPGEGPEVIAQKAEARRRAERQMQIGSGTAAEQAGDISQPYAAPIRADELARAGIGGGPASQPVVIDGVTIRKVN